MSSLRDGKRVKQTLFVTNLSRWFSTTFCKHVALGSLVMDEVEKDETKNIGKVGKPFHETKNTGKIGKPLDETKHFEKAGKLKSGTQSTQKVGKPFDEEAEGIEKVGKPFDETMNIEKLAKPIDETKNIQKEGKPFDETKNTQKVGKPSDETKNIEKVAKPFDETKTTVGKLKGETKNTQKVGEPLNEEAEKAEAEKVDRVCQENATVETPLPKRRRISRKSPFLETDLESPPLSANNQLPEVCCGNST